MRPSPPPQSLLSNFSWPYRYIRERERGRETIDKNASNISPLDRAPGLGLARACRPLRGMFCFDLYIFNLFSYILLLEEAVPMPRPRSRVPAPLYKNITKKHVLFMQKTVFFWNSSRRYLKVIGEIPIYLFTVVFFLVLFRLQTWFLCFFLFFV